MGNCQPSIQVGPSVPTERRGQITRNLCLALLLPCALLATPGWARDVTVGIYQNPPKLFLDASGEARGILVEMLEAIAADEGWTLRYQPCDWSQCMTMLESGHIDLLPDMAVNTQRMQRFDMHQTAALHSWSQLYRHSDVSIESVRDLDGLRIAMLADSVQESTLTAMQAGFDSDFEIIAVNSLDEAFARVQAGAADAAVSNHFFGNYRAADYDLVETPIVFQPAALYYAAARGRNGDLLQAIDRYLPAWKRDNSSPYFSAQKRWAAPIAEPVLPAAFRSLLLMLVGAGLLLLAGVLFLRRQIARRTQELGRLNRLYALRSECNRAVARCADDRELLHAICKAAVKQGQMRMAWIGLIESDSQGVVPVARCGKGSGEIDAILARSGLQGAEQHDPSSMALVNDQPCWSDQLDGAEFDVWRNLIDQHGWSAAAALPLHRNDAVIGVMTLFAGEADAFDAAARELLVDMSRDIDFALLRLDTAAERNRLAAQVIESKERYQDLTENINDVIWTMDPETLQLTYVSPSVINVTGFSADEVMNQAMDAGLSREQARHLRKRIANSIAALRNGTLDIDHVFTDQVEQKCKDGSRVWTEIVSSFRHNRRSGALEIRGVTRDISERRRAEAEIQRLVQFDQLTGLANRDTLRDRFEQTAALARREQRPFALLCLGLDRFKTVNDSLGHDAGDQLLVETARRLSAALRSGDSVCRLGADEFALLLPATDSSAAGTIAEQLLQQVARASRIADKDIAVTASAGIAMFPEDGVDMDTLLRKADAAMYRVKQTNPAGFGFFALEMQSRNERTLLLSSALRNAIARHELAVHYQPVMRLRDDRIVACEALLRWNHPELGAVLPDEFIPIAEATGLIIGIGEWVLEQATCQARKWQLQGLPAITVAVNLSALQLRNSDLPQRISAILTRNELAAENLEIELTEAAAMSDPEAAMAIMKQLNAANISIAIDDFGTGYSSLSYIKRFKARHLKIDKSFINDLCDDHEDRAIVIAVIKLAESLGIGTIAEGVETQEQLAFLRRNGCTLAQGYLIGKPMPAEQFETLLRQQAQTATLT